MFNDYKTAQDRLNKAGTNDFPYYIVVFIVGIITALVVTEHIIGVEGIGDIIFKMR